MPDFALDEALGFIMERIINHGDTAYKSTEMYRCFRVQKVSRAIHASVGYLIPCKPLKWFEEIKPGAMRNYILRLIRKVGHSFQKAIERSELKGG